MASLIRVSCFGEGTGMGMARTSVCDIQLDGFSLDDENDVLPHEDLLKEKTSIDPALVYSALISQRLTVKDAYIEVGPYCFPISDMIDVSESEQKRVKRGAPNSFIPPRDYITTDPPYTKSVSKAAVLRAYKKVGPRTEKSCEDRLVMKGTLISIARSLNDLLIYSGEHDMGSDFDKSELRYDVIADWINWMFLKCYGINSRYSGEQIRQMIKSKSSYLGRFVTVPFEACFPEIYP